MKNIFETMNESGFCSVINSLCETTPDLKTKILLNIDSPHPLNKRCNKRDQTIILQNLGICILDPRYRECIVLHAKPWLLEILSWVKSLIGSFNTGNYNLPIHSSLSVCLGNINNDDIQKFTQDYFQEAPSPFHSLTISEVPLSKKLKLDYDVPIVSELEILDATFNLLSRVGTEIFNHWEFSDLLKYFSHKNEKLRWFACNCVALFLNMSEVEKNKLLAKYVSVDIHNEMITTMCGKERISSRCNIPNTVAISPRYTCKIGQVILPLYAKIKSQRDELVLLPSTQRNLENIALGISTNRPVLIEGLVGSGKTSLVTHLAALTGRTYAPQLSKIQLSDQTDSKTLIGTYRCTANPGEFIWQAGSLTQAVMEGYWLLLEDIDFAPLDVISLLIPLLESRVLPVPGIGNIKAHPNFQVLGTRRILPAGCRMRIGSANLIEKLWTKVSLCPLSSVELKQLICEKWSDLTSVSDKLVEVYMILSSEQHGEETNAKKCDQCGTLNLTSAKTSGRFVSVRDLMKWCSRMVSHITEQDLNSKAFQEALDCFCSSVPDAKIKYTFALHIGSHLNVNEAMVTYYFNNFKPEVRSKATEFSVGSRAVLPRLKRKHVSMLESGKSVFSKTRLSSCLLEKVTVSVMNEEPVLLVGETGTGKTSIIQYLARHTNHPLRVINMNQQSDSSDLLGGFKPVEIRTIVTPLKKEFEELFVNTFSAKQNTKFLSHIMTSFAGQKWEDFFVLVKHSKDKGMSKLDQDRKEAAKEKKSGTKDNSNSSGRKTVKEITRLVKQWSEFEFKLEAVKDQIQKVKSSLAFAYIEGSLVKAVLEGEWVLLDEINLASADTLECLSGLLECSTGSLTLHERGDNKPIQRHTNFRLFACMNPATDVGKKELPVGLRNRFTEFFVEEIQDLEDLKQIVYEYLKDLNPSPKQITGIVQFYSDIKLLASTSLIDATGHKPHYSLRTLCRALIVARRNPCKSFVRSLYEAFSLSFLTQLDQASYQKVAALLKNTFKTNINTLIPSPENQNNYIQVEGFWVPIGNLTPLVPEKYILTNTVRSNLKDLVRIVSIGRFPVLLQGDTSVGKTSLITYLAKLTGNNCVRINNHQHTDLQEYIGSYAPDHTGKLVFMEGVLVQAMRRGDWVILDELNLAPSDVLEALNRLLDDNRELFIPEIETTVKAHPKFMLFATQNPPGLYGGRQVLSRAFRNRFVELHFDVIPATELQVILKERCDIPETLSKKMVLVLQDLQIRRRTSNVFQGKQSFITLRDLFRWAERYRLAPKISTTFYDWDQHMADEGYLVLAGKIRLEEETDAIVQVLKTRLKKNVTVENLFNVSEGTSPVTKPFLEKLEHIKGFEHIVWTYDMRRLYVLISKALSFCEPVLLVGETGCGKTTVCQMIASIKEQKLYTINCHMHTEGADFLGGLRPVRDRASADDDRLFEWVDGPLIQSMKDGGMFLADEISLADDSVLERLNSVLEPERTLVLSEKAGDVGDESCLEMIVANKYFRLVGTMNPGGDYGKKELSPALRNRLTEIWCPKVEIKRSTDDVKLIIKHNIEKSLNQDLNIEESMVYFLKYFTETELGKKLTVSIRDILSWVFFINKVTMNNALPVDVGMAYIHGACLILLDGLGSGTSGSAVQNWKSVKEKALKCLFLQAQKMNQKLLDPSILSDVNKFVLRNDDDKFGIEPFVITKRNVKNDKVPSFAFEAPMTCLNLLRLLRGLQLNRPILLEGSPGVGKTSLVVALAKASSNDIVRINLSEQTDVSDLFGADLPEEGSEGGRFSWRDGPLLQALKNGSWIVLDELNLASQSVLEGLNACFDHRGEVYIPELNKTFVLQHGLTKIFACQNPQYEGGARKGLPKSFLNRFTQVYVEPLSSFDLEFILSAIHAQIPSDIISKMVKFNEVLVEEIQEKKIWGTKGGPWELNLRDMFRWCEMIIQNQRQDNDFNPGEFVEFIYADRMRTESDKDEVYRVYSSIFSDTLYPLYRKSGTFHINNQSIQVGRASLPRKTSGIEWKENTDAELFILHNQTPYLESLINSINMKWMTLLVGSSSEGKSSLVWLLSRLAGQRLETMSVNSHMDVTELLGGFEQADYGRRLAELIESLQNLVWNQVRKNLLVNDDVKVVGDHLALWKRLCQVKDEKIRKTTTEEVKHFINICQAVQRLTNSLEQSMTPGKMKKLKNIRQTCKNLRLKVQSTSTVSGGGTFEWVDSPLVKALRNGYWLLIDGVNLCSPSVLDRLNGLLEPEGVLTMSERGVVGSEVPTITPHPNFRLFLTMDHQHGEISRAMRNRGMEVYVLGMWQNDLDVKSLMLSQGLQNENIQKFLSEVYWNVSKALPGMERPSISCLAQSAALTRRLLELGQSIPNAVELSLNLSYMKSFSRPGLKNKIQQVLIDSLKNSKKLLKSSDSATVSVSNLCCLSSKALLCSSSLGLPVQLAALLDAVSSRKSKQLSKLVLPESLLSSRNRFGIALFHSLVSIPLKHWDVLYRMLSVENVSEVRIMKIVNVTKNIVTDPAVTLQLLENISDGELSADPRFNFTALSAKVGCSDLNVVSSLANKALIAMWFRIEEAATPKTIKSDNRKPKMQKTTETQTIYELSVGISKGLVGKKMIHHPSLRYLAPLMHSVSNLIYALSDNTEVGLSDDEYFRLKEAIAWNRRFRTLCEEVVVKNSFHNFLPQLVFHWKYLQDIFLDKIPAAWDDLVPEKMVSVVKKLKQEFSAHCSPLHQLIPEIRDHLGFPLPFTNEISAATFVQLRDVAELLVPHAEFENEKEIEKAVFLASKQGFEVKDRLVSVAFDLAESSDIEEQMEDIKLLENIITENLSKVFVRNAMVVNNVKLWPLMDYFVSNQLLMTNISGLEGVQLSECRDILAKSSFVPHLMIRNSDSLDSMATVAYYLFNISNSSAVCPGTWLNYDNLIAENKDTAVSLAWDGEKNFVLSRMGCNLTYHLLSGFIKPDSEVDFVRVGNHAEREVQLNKIRKTLWENWVTFSTPSYQYGSRFKETIKIFVTNLLDSLNKTFISNATYKVQSNYDIFALAENLIVSCKGLVGSEGYDLLQAILTLGRAAERDDISVYAELGVLSGLLQSWLLSHIEPLDPAQQRTLLLSYCKDELREYEDSLTMFKWIKVLTYSHSLKELHPHYTHYEEEVEKLKSKIASLCQKVAHRPEPSQYNEISQEISHFLKTLFHPTRITNMLQMLTGDSSDSLLINRKCEATLRSCDIFIKKLLNSYPLYRDLVIPLLHGVVTACESLRILMVLARNKDLSSSIAKVDVTGNAQNLDDVLSSMLYFPYVRNLVNPNEFLTQKVNDQKCVAHLIKENTSNVNFVNQSHSLGLRASFYDLLNQVSSQKLFSKDSFLFMKSLLQKVIVWWREQEDEKKRKEEEEQSQYRNKARIVAASETEEEESQRRFKEIFPDYENEFEDLKTSDQDKDMDDEEQESDEGQDVYLKLTKEYMDEVIEVHRLLVSSYTEALWIEADKVNETKPVTPVVLRTNQIQLLMKLIGPFGTHNVDCAALGSLVLTNHTSCSIAKNSSNIYVVNKPFNYYHDSALEESLKVRPLLETLGNKVDEFLERWPEHPSLKELKKVVERVLNFSVDSPLIRLVIGLETVLVKAEDWEKFSHKEIKLITELTPIMKQVKEWRKMELKAWKSCLDMITHNFYEQANKSWPHLYHTFLTVNLENVNELIQVLKEFMEKSSNFGTFERHLEILKAFHYHLCLESKHCIDDEERKIFKELIAVTWNFYKYYQQYLPIIRETLKNEKKPIEKKVKDFIKISQWNEQNFFAFKKSVTKSKEQLHAYMREWDSVLKRKFSPLLVDVCNDVERVKGEWDKETTIPNFIIKPSEFEVSPVIADEKSFVHKLPSLSKKSFDLINNIIDKIPYTINIEAVDEMTIAILTNYDNLIVATSKAENLQEKEERMKSLKEIMNRKKKALANLFKTLHHYGISYTKGNSVWKKDDIDKCLVVPPLDIKVTLKEVQGHKISEKCMNSCDKYFYKNIGRQALLIESLTQGHKDLGPEDMKRLKGCSSYFLILLRQLRQVIPELCSNTSEIDNIINEIDRATMGYVPVSDEFEDWWKKVHSLMGVLSLTLEEEIEIFETYPICNSLLEILPKTHSFSQDEIENIKTELKCILMELNSLIVHTLKTNKTLSNERVVKLSSVSNMDDLVEVVRKLSVLEEKLSSSVRIFDEEFSGTTSLSKPLISWIKEWKKTFDDFSNWNVNLSPIQDKDYISSDNIEICILKMLKCIEELFKRHCQTTSNKSDDVETLTKDMISVGIIQSLVHDHESLRGKDIKDILMKLVEELKNNSNTSVLIALKSVKPILHQYLTMSKNILASMVESFRSVSKLHSILLGIFQQIAMKGFCRPQGLEEQAGDNEGATQFQDSGPGLSEGEGMKDVSDRLESEDQLESALQEGEKEPEGDKSVPEETGVEISHDFEGALQDVEQNEEEENEKDNDDEEEEDLDKQMGETEKGADKLDEKLWGDEDEEEDEEKDEDGKDKEDEKGPGDGEKSESQIVAKDDDNENKEENEDQEKKKKKELEVMEEDRREAPEEEEEETYDDNYKDKLGGEEQPDEKDEEKQMDLPDDLNLEDNEKDQEDPEEDNSDMNPEIEVKDLFPEEEKEQKEKQPEEGGNDDDDEEGKNNAENDEEKPHEEDIEEGDKSDKGRQTTGEELEENEEKDEGGDDEEQPIPSNDVAATAEAQSADMETMEASKDKTKNNPETATKAQPEQDEDQKQEEQGEVGEQTEDITGVGQSDSRTKEESHIGETSALTNEEDAKQKMENQNKPRKPGDQNQTKSLGEIEKDIHHGLLTSKEKKYKEEEGDDSEEKQGKENEAENKDADMYEHIQKSDEKFDKQTVDAGTHEEAKLVPAPVEEEQENKDDPEGIVDSLMEVEEEKEEPNPKEESRKREAENEANEGADVKRRRGENNPEINDEMNDYETVIEGDVVTEMIVQRPIVNEIITQLDEEEVVAAIFNEDVATTRENIKEAEEGDVEKGSEQWEELEGRVSSLALQLCEQLRLILEPTEAAKLRGDYRTGKRLNMRKVIPYIASQFRKDKIWLRRSQPSKRSYQVLLAVDDSQSMTDVNAGTLARESIALVAKALTLLEVGQVGVISFGEETTILHPFYKPFSDIDGGKIFGNLNFAQNKSNFAQMLEDSVALLASARGGSSVNSEIAQLLLIVSDGQTHARSKAVKEAVRAAREARVFIVFLVLDAHDNKYSFYDHLAYEDGQLRSIVETFPFPFFIVVRDLDSLPDAIATALRQWFELVTADVH